MPEKFLHLVWNHCLFEVNSLQTVHQEPLLVIKKGKYNYGQGPDFREAVIQMGGVQWNGSIEIETYSQNWYLHHHNENPEFNNVILLVCYENNCNHKILNANGWEIPILELKPFVLREAVYKLEVLLQQEVPCKPFIAEFPAVLQKNLLIEKCIERLENKLSLYKDLDLEVLSWRMLWKSFGDPYHSELFLQVAENLPPTYFFDCAELLQKEALAFGVAGFLMGSIEDSYFQELQEAWNYLKIKYSLRELSPSFVNFKTRFHSYPHVLMAQLAAWFHEHGNKLLSPEYVYFENFGTLSTYWQNHVFWGKLSKAKVGMGKQKILKLLVNWYFPFHWHFSRLYQSENTEKILEQFFQTPKEDNQIVRKMEAWGWKIENGLESQGAIELYKKFCLEKRCLECHLGQWYLNQSSFQKLKAK